MVNKDISAVRQSYGRAIAKRVLVKRFYEIFMSSSPEIPKKFANTDFNKQHEMLERSLTMALLFTQDNIIAKQSMAKIRESHNRKNLDIHPRYYKLWLDSMIQAISELDPEFNPELEKQWREVISMAVDYVKEGY